MSNSDKPFAPRKGSNANIPLKPQKGRSMSATNDLASPLSPNSPSTPVSLKGFLTGKHGKQTSESVLTQDKPLAESAADEGGAEPSGHSSTPSLSNENNNAVPDEEGRIGGRIVPHMPRPDDSLAQRRQLQKHSKFQNLLTRKPPGPGRLDDEAMPSGNTQRSTTSRATTYKESPSSGSNPQTAPLNPERGFRDMMDDSSHRNRSAERAAAVESEDDGAATPQNRMAHPAAQNATLMSNFVTSSRTAADGLGRAGNRFFAKFARTGSSHEREQHAAENYQIKVITLPLIEQTRLTRIRRSMEEAKDKTEFWMPALPYRCIDYLNHYGVEVEGLYRIPGSGREIKQWQMRFDTGPNYDVDLLDENIELYDINVVGSMLKTWLRDMPDELLPKAVQQKISLQCQGATETPQLMRDELSRLPPYNYYLLFAITCHISLLHSHSDKNKMNYHNLCVCFQPSLKVDGFCFNFLVTDWRNCWQGCWTEKEYLTEETKLAETRAREASTSTGRSTPGAVAPGKPADDRSRTTATKSKKRTDASTSRERNVPPKSSGAATASAATAANGDTAKQTNNSESKSGDLAQASSQTQHRASTPPSLEPVANVSPMRM